jgi:hypothetical protein
MWRASEDLRTLPEDVNFWQTKLQKYQDRLASYISCQMPKISENMHKLKPYKILCNLSDADNVFQLTVCTYRGAVTVCAICRLPAINYRWSYMSVGAVLDKIKSVNCWQTCVSTSMYIEAYDGLCHLWDAGNIWQLKVCKFRNFLTINNPTQISYRWKYINFEVIWYLIPYITCCQSLTNEFMYM